MEAVKGLADRFLEWVGRTMFVRLTAFYALIMGFLGLCAVPLLGLLSGVTFLSGVALDSQTRIAQGVFDPQVDAELESAISGLSDVSVLTGGVTILALVAGLGLLIVSVGLFRRANWGRNGFIITGGIDVVISVLLFSAFDVLQLASILLTAFIIFIFVTDEGVKQIFTVRQASAG